MDSPTAGAAAATGTPTPVGVPSRIAVLGGLATAVATALLMVATSPRMAIVWDEGFTLGREERVRQWFQALGDPAGFARTWQPPTPLETLVPQDDERPPPRDRIDSVPELLRAPAIEWFWPFARQEPHGHPPFYALVGLIGDVVAPSWEPLARARLGPLLAFSLTAGAIFAAVARRAGTWPAVAAAAAWSLSPQLFGHAHYAHYDGLLTCLWTGSILAFAAAVEPAPGRPDSSWRPRWMWVLLFGALAGCAAGTKLTGWFLPLPAIAWTALYRDRRAVISLLAGGLVAAAVLYAIVPPWWLNPVGGVEAFLASNLSRARTTRIPTLFLGHVYVTPRSSLPWYNTLAWTAMVTPIGFLLLGLGGVAVALRRARTGPFAVLILLHWAFLLALRALPSAPGHDGVRQFLAAFGVFALLVGLGAAGLIRQSPRWGRGLIAAAVAEGAVSVVLILPVPLSYFSPLVGGLPGAARLGMEPTYYWDSLGDEARAWIDAHTPPGRSVLFATNPTSWSYLRQSGRLATPVAGLEPDAGEPAWYVVQNRPGMFRPVDRALVDRLGPDHVLASKFGVPLLWAFPFSAYLAEDRQARAAAAAAEPDS